MCIRDRVKRGVIELVTPGVVLGDNILANKENTYLAAVYFCLLYTSDLNLRERYPN